MKGTLNETDKRHTDYTFCDPAGEAFLMFKFMLVIYLLLSNGQWVKGEDFDGWSPREQPDWKTCIERRDKAMTMPLPRGVKAIKWSCRKFIYS